jgi:hypothetical protein
MKTKITLILFAVCFQMFAWGPTGHRVVGEIAERHLTKKARKKVKAALEGESLAMCSNWMDFIKSERSYDSLSSWHYVTIPSLDKYHHEGELKGDVIQAIDRFIRELESKEYSVDEKFALRCLVHLVGDIHQPLHVGNGEDRGGNQVKVKWFGRKTNLHRVWDSDIIDNQKISYTEYANWINVTEKDQVAKWQEASIMTWVEESISYRESIYDLPEEGKLGYRYNYDHIEQVNLRLVQAGIRLAGVLNQIYG